MAPVTALSVDRVAVSARGSPPQAASSAMAVSVADSVLVIVILSLVVGPIAAGLFPIPQNRHGAPPPVVTPVTTAA